MSTKINSFVFRLEVYTYSIVVSAQMPNLVWIPWVMCRNGGKNSKFFTKSFNAERNRFPQVKYWLYERVQGVKNIFLRSETMLLHKNCYQGKSVKNSALYLTCVSLKMTDTHKSCNDISDNTISDRFVVMFSWYSVSL